MSRYYTFHIFETGEPYSDDHCQIVKDEDGNSVFYVANLTHCPEDAIIGRDLVDAIDYIQAVKYGLELAKQGYDYINWVWEEEGE